MPLCNAAPLSMYGTFLVRLREFWFEFRNVIVDGRCVKWMVYYETNDHWHCRPFLLERREQVFNCAVLV